MWNESSSWIFRPHRLVFTNDLFVLLRRVTSCFPYFTPQGRRTIQIPEGDFVLTCTWQCFKTISNLLGWNIFWTDPTTATYFQLLILSTYYLCAIFDEFSDRFLNMIQKPLSIHLALTIPAIQLCILSADFDSLDTTEWGKCPLYRSYDLFLTISLYVWDD